MLRMIEPLFKKRIIYKSLCVYVYVAICEGYVYRGGISFLLQISKKLLISFNLKERAFKTLTKWSGFCLLLPWVWPWQKELLSFITEHRWFKFWLQSSSAVWLAWVLNPCRFACLFRCSCYGNCKMEKDERDHWRCMPWCGFNLSSNFTWIRRKVECRGC